MTGRWFSLVVALCVFCVWAVGCDGETGPQGEAGAKGDSGEQGEPGAPGENGEDGEDGEPGGPGEPGAPGEDGEDGAPGQDGVDGVDGMDGMDGIGKAADEPMTEEEMEDFEQNNAACLACHASMTPHMIEDYSMSKMAKAGVGCEDCHALNQDSEVVGEGHRLMPSPETCGACHPNQYKGHRSNRHSISFIRQLECGRYDDFPKEFQVGSGYHFTEDDVMQLEELMNTGSQGAIGQGSVTSMQTCGGCHAVENKCDACHGRHRFSPHQAREPLSCGTCHMGPDHPQVEMYETSRHGVRFSVFGDTKTTPTCVDCHMPYNTQMLGKKTAEDGTEYTDHDLSMGLAFGPVGGGTIHKSFVMDEDTGRVKFKARDDDALYQELWLDRADNALYDAPDGGEVAYENLFEMGMADASGNGKQDYVVVQTADSADDLLANRDFMRTQVCGQCHSNNMADENLLIADLIHENAKIILAEGFDIVKALALVGYMTVDTDGKTPNPETGTTGTYGANMKTRNLTELEKMYFTAMKYASVMTWKGAYHQNPDYTHWLGYNALVMELGSMGDEATDTVLNFIWINDDVYPGATGDLYVDQIFQGVVYETGSLVNTYDKYPGPDDPGADQPIDVDMDGEPEFLPVPGEPGTFMFGETQVMFH